MRIVTMGLVLGLAARAWGQQATSGSDPYGQVSAAPPPLVQPAPAPAPPVAAPPMAAPDPTATVRLAPQAPPLAVSLRGQWRGARVLNGFAGALALASTGLSLSSAIYIGATGYPPSDLTSAPQPSDTSQVLSWVSSGSSVLGIGLGAAGLAWRHHILRRLDADPGRGLFISGSVVAGIGVAAILVSYIIGFSDVGSPRDRSIISLATSLGGSAFCNSAAAMYAKDSANMTKVWRSLGTF